jgi:proteic killer suppression protein
MIRSFKGEFAEAIHDLRAVPKGFSNDIAAVCRRKLVILNSAVLLQDLASPPGNRLEALKDDRKGYHSIRVNDQWRIVFRWTEAGPEEVELSKHYKR